VPRGKQFFCQALLSEEELISDHAQRPRRPLFWPALVAASLSVLMAATWGCASRPIDDPVEVARCRNESAATRIRAVTLVPDAQAQQLIALVWSSRHPIDVRRAAVDRMIQADADAFWSDVVSGIRRVDDWPMITLLCERAANDQRTNMTPGLIASWSRPSTRFDDEHRPERQAIQSLWPGRPLEEILWDRFSAELPRREDQRVAQSAWTVLVRISDESALRDRLRAGEPGNDLHAQLRGIEGLVDVLPGDREALLRLNTLTAESSAQDWARRERLVRSLRNDAGPRTLALRHLPAIDALGDADVSQDRQATYRRLASDLQGRRHYHRGDGAQGENVRSMDESLAGHLENLGWADLLVLDAINLLLWPKAVRGSSSAVADLFVIADADQRDQSTEFGGVLVRGEASGARWRVALYDPARKQHDEVFHASDACVRAMHTGLAHFHFHAQRHDNAVWAGPGGGDFQFADNLHANCIVLTFIDRDTLNVDAYFPGAVVVDLGCIRRR